MGRPPADDQARRGLADDVQSADAADVDEQGRLGQPELEQGQQAVAAGEHLGLALPVAQGGQGVLQGGRPHVVELGWDHRRRPSL